MHVEQVLGLGVEFRAGVHIDSMKHLLAEGYDAVFVATPGAQPFVV